MAGGVEQMGDGQHRIQPVGQLMGRGDTVGDLGQGDLLFRPGDAGGHGGLADQERAGDLGGGQPAHQPQGQGDLGLGGERGMAAGEEQP